MGIRGLNNLLEKFDCHQTFLEIPDNIKTIAIDANLYLCKYMHSKNTELLYNLLNQALKFLSSNITPIYIFDGKAPDEKNFTLKKRKIKKQNIVKKINALKKSLDLDPTNQYIIDKINHLQKLCKTLSVKILKDVKQLLDILNIKYFDAKGEADYLCCKLSKLNLVDACLTEDMDFLLLGAPIIINFKKKGLVNYLDKEYIINKFNFTENQFIELCLILGSDYHKFKIKIKSSEAFDNINKYKSIQNWIEYEDSDVIKNYLINCIRIKNFIIKTYNNTPIPNYNFQNPIFKFININIIKKFFNHRISKKSFHYHNTNSVRNNIEFINSLHIEI